MIYYPRLDWQNHWGGGTVVQETNQHPTLLQYEGNRLITFTANLLHQAQSVSRECYHLRTCVVFKCSKTNSNVNFFRNAIKDNKFAVKNIN